jgi:hypothetical protein
VIFKRTLIAWAHKHDALSESQKETEYLENYNDVKKGKTSKETEYLDESYDDDVNADEQVEEG